jgi:hypothetical protein
LWQQLTQYDRVLQLDADMLIRHDCPSPFDLVPAENIGVVSRVQPRIGRKRFESRKEMWARHMGLTPYDSPQQHLNAGLILYGPTIHRKLLTEWRNIGEQCNWSTRCTVPEQFALSCLLQSMAVPVTWLPHQFNTISARFRPPGPMRTYIYHFNGPRGRDLEHAARKYEWRITCKRGHGSNGPMQSFPGCRKTCR